MLAKPAKKTAEGLPVKFDQDADYEIPRRLFSAFKPDFGPREIRREMRPDERAMIEARAAALELALRPFDPDEERIAVTASLAAMFSGFRAMRQQGDDIESTVTITRAVLRDFPAWAITQGCLKIARGDVKIDKRFAPNDSQIFDVVQGIVASYRDNLDQARALLEAPLEIFRHMAPRERQPAPPAHDGKHGARVAADLAARKSRKEPEGQQP